MPTPSLTERMAALGIHEDDLLEKFIRGSGSGGQKINKTSSCVFLKHSKSGIEVKVQRERSRELNRTLAREELCAQLENRIASKQQEQTNARAKKRRQHRPHSKRAKIRNTAQKRKQSHKKKLRQKPSSSD